MKRPHLGADLGRPRWDLITAYRPSWADSTLVRRLLAAALTVLAGVLLLRGDPADHPTDTVVAAHDLAPGRVVDAADLRRVTRPAGTLPDGAVRDAAPLLGATVTGAVRNGEVLTDLRVLGPRLAAATTGAADARVVPIRLADNAVADILRIGDRVDVVSAPESSADGAPEATPRTLATDAVIVLIAGAAKGHAADERIVLVALGGARATAVAGASLHAALTVVVH